MKERKKLLIVDDERSILLSLGHFLDTENVEVITCNRAEFAKTAIENHFFELVILDLRLSGPDEREGLELLEYIKKRSPKTKVIVITAYGSDEIKKAVVERGADRYFDKPVDLNDLVAAIRRFGVPVSEKKIKS